MKYKFWTVGVFFVWTVCFPLPSFAQQARESADFTDRVWWGGGFALGFSAVNQVTSVQLGVSPMVGYKITNGFSVGPRVSLLASYFSSRFGVVRSNKIAPTYAGGVFARQKLFRDIFAHTEYELENRAYVTPDGSQLLVSRNTNHNYYIGAGYNAGGAEFLILYNLSQGQYFNVSPYVFRFGFTRNF